MFTVSLAQFPKLTFIAVLRYLVSKNTYVAVYAIFFFRVLLQFALTGVPPWYRVLSPSSSPAGEKQYKFEEILPIYQAVAKETDTGTFADFMEAFKTFDREGQGFISAAELRHVIQNLGKDQTTH